MNKASLTNSKNIYHIKTYAGLIEFINANLEKVIIYNLPEYFTVFHSILLRIVFDKIFEYVILLFYLLIVIILLIFDAV